MKILCYIKLLNGNTETKYLTVEELESSDYKVAVTHQNWQGMWTSLHIFDESYIQFKNTNPTIWLSEIKNTKFCNMKSFNT